MYTLIYDATLTEQFESDIKPLLNDWACHYLPYSTDLSAEQITTQQVLTWLPDASFYHLLPIAIEQQWDLGIVVHPDMPRVKACFAIEDDASACLERIASAQEPHCVDVLKCNDRMVLSSVMVGDEAILKPQADAAEHFISRFWGALKAGFSVSDAKLTRFDVVTEKGVELQTAAVGMAMVYRPGASDFTKRVVGLTEKDEACLHAVLLAPRSMTQLIHYLWTRVVFNQPRENDVLPEYVGYIRTQSLELKSPCKEYLVDGQIIEGDALRLEVQADALNIINAQTPEKLSLEEAKESVKSANLPRGESLAGLCGRTLPWIYHADQDEVKETFMSLRDNARLSESYVVLMVLATVLATIGLFANSAPVIIGAMILAPMMSPIISLSMGVLRQNHEWAIESGKTLLMGIGIALCIGVVSTWFTPLNNLNEQISARLSPTLLDLGVSIFSGIAGAYASARSEVAKNLAGVAIAVALVPPLAVSAIGIGWWDWPVFWGAFLLFLANLIGMVLAAAGTFWVMGFSPFHLAKKGLFWLMPVVFVVSIPLVFAFQTLVKEQAWVQQLESMQFQSMQLSEVRVRSGEPVEVSAKLLHASEVSSDDMKALKRQIEATLQQPVRLELVHTWVQ